VGKLLLQQWPSARARLPYPDVRLLGPPKSPAAAAQPPPALALAAPPPPAETLPAGQPRHWSGAESRYVPGWHDAGICTTEPSGHAKPLPSQQPPLALAAAARAALDPCELQDDRGSKRDALARTPPPAAAPKRPPPAESRISHGRRLAGRVRCRPH
jgi:hypothetical protein